MKKAPQDLIQNKTAVFWLQNPFCSTSACQLAPLGKGGNPGISLGNRENTGEFRRLKSPLAGRQKSEYSGFWRTQNGLSAVGELGAPWVCTPQAP